MTPNPYSFEDLIKGYPTNSILKNTEHILNTLIHACICINVNIHIMAKMTFLWSSQGIYILLFLQGVNLVHGQISEKFQKRHLFGFDIWKIIFLDKILFFFYTLNGDVDTSKSRQSRYQNIDYLISFHMTLN